MSTILDALKKVELERETDVSAAQQRQLESMQPAADKRSWGRARKGIVAGLLAILCVTMGAVTYYLFKDNSQAFDSRAAVSDTDRSEDAPLAKNQDQTAKASRKRFTPEPRSVKPQPKTRQPALSQTNEPASSLALNQAAPQAAQGQRDRAEAISKPPVEKTAPRPEPQTMPSATNPASNMEPAPKAAASSPVSRSAPPRKMTPPPEPRQQQTTPATPSHSHIDRLTDGSLNVQAIAWSPIAEERMAVINSQIVREGNSVDDYSLVTIGQDDVVVRKGGSSFRVVIGRP